MGILQRFELFFSSQPKFTPQNCRVHLGVPEVKHLQVLQSSFHESPGCLSRPFSLTPHPFFAASSLGSNGKGAVKGVQPTTPPEQEQELSSCSHDSPSVLLLPRLSTQPHNFLLHRLTSFAKQVQVLQSSIHEAPCSRPPQVRSTGAGLLTSANNGRQKTFPPVQTHCSPLLL